MMNEDDDNPSWPSFLIELDLAIKEQGDGSSGAHGKTSTRAFMAIGVLYGEKHSLASVSLWTRNVQLSLYSLFPALPIGVLWQDGAEISRSGFFVGYNPLVWAPIAPQALGGTVVAVCITYTDNMAKNFAASISIVFSCVASTLLFENPLMVNVSGPVRSQAIR
jgi:UDP-galactose transporter